MPAKEEVKDNVKDGIKTVVGLASTIVEKVPEELDSIIGLLEDRNTELRLKFDSLTLDGDIALSLSLFKRDTPKKK